MKGEGGVSCRSGSLTRRFVEDCRQALKDILVTDSTRFVFLMSWIDTVPAGDLPSERCSDTQLHR